MITQAETTPALATTCVREGLPKVQAPLGSVYHVNSSKLAWLVCLCDGGRWRAGPEGICTSSHSTSLKGHLLQSQSGFGDGEQSGEGGHSASVIFSTYICEHQEFHISGFKGFKESLPQFLFLTFFLINIIIHEVNNIQLQAASGHLGPA